MSGLSVAQAGWARSRERGSALLIRFIVWLACKLPRAAVTCLLYPIVSYFVLSSPRQHKASTDFLMRVLGRPPRASEVFVHYLTFARMVLDRVYWLQPTPRPLVPVSESGTHLLEEALRDKKGLIIAGSHLGSFEALRSLGARTNGRRVRPLMYVDNAQKLQSLLNAVNPQLARDVIVAGRPQTMLEVRDALAQGDLVGVLADRSPFAEASVEVDFMGDRARFPIGAYRLALLLDVPIFFGCAVLEGNGYRVFFEPIDGPRSTLSRATRDAWVRGRAEAFARSLERYARRYPFNWFNFYDFWHEDATEAM